MQPATIHALVALNQRFYETFGPAFAATRRRIQDGVRRVLAELPDAPGARWLDLGCGSGSLAAAWRQAGRQSAYLGLDFSDALLDEARQAVAALPGAADGPVTFARADLSQPGWSAGLARPFDGALSFAVLHHLPSRDARLGLLKEVRALLAPGGRFTFSVWQFQNSPKLMARRLPWAAAGLDERDLEPGDTLLDWRFALPGQPEQTGLRYVHLFSAEELAEHAQTAGFRVLDAFESDGQGGRLSLYQVWQRAE